MPIIAVFYATAAFVEQPLHTLWPSLLMLLVALIPGAVYVSTINDATDRAEDLAAGKPVRDVTPLTVGLIVGTCVAAGIVVGWSWQDDPALLGSYAAAWFAFSLYSLPPFRFKARAGLGVLCDAAGSSMWPSLVAVLLVYRAAGASSRDGLWLTAVGVWALAYGLRGILWHQLSDVDADQRAGVRTFVQVHGVRRVRGLGTWVVFPVELLALIVILAHLPSMWPGLALVCYITFAWAQVREWDVSAVIVAPTPRSFIVLLDYYGVFLPVALLGASGVAHPAGLIVLAAHCLMFPIRISETVRTVWRLVRFREHAGRVHHALRRRWPFSR